MVTPSKDALSFSLCFDTASLAHRDAVRGERHPPHLFMNILLVTVPPLLVFVFFNRQIVAE
jgi:hypothetical protein